MYEISISSEGSVVRCRQADAGSESPLARKSTSMRILGSLTQNQDSSLLLTGLVKGAHALFLFYDIHLSVMPSSLARLSWLTGFSSREESTRLEIEQSVGHSTRDAASG